MKNVFLTFLFMQALIVFGQRSDGFFVQEYCFIDPVLLKGLKVDKFEIQLFENNRKTGKLEIFLDSNQRMIKQIADYADSIRTTMYESTTISQFACPVARPDYIKNCDGGRITKTESNGAYRITAFDLDGKVTSDRWKPGSKLLEIKRQFIYTNENLMDTVYLEDIKIDGSIDKKELHIYTYDDGKLISISQLINFSDGYQDAGSFQFKNYNCGLVKRMEGKAYFGQYKAKVEFKFYSSGQLLN